jgi:hypothetical protein
MDKRLLLGMAKEHANFYQHDDPWDLPAYFLLRKNKWKSLRTYSGYWKVKEDELTAIRSSGESSSSSSASPSYVGVRKTLEFYLNDGTRGGEGTKTDWIIHEYYDLRKDDAGAALFLQVRTVVPTPIALQTHLKKKKKKKLSLCRHMYSRSLNLSREMTKLIISYEYMCVVYRRMWCFVRCSRNAKTKQIRSPLFTAK